MYRILHCVDSLDLPKTKQFQQKHKIYRYLWITSVTKHMQTKDERREILT